MLNIIAPITEQTSYGIVAVNVIKELAKHGVAYALFPVSGQIGNGMIREPYIQAGVINAESFSKFVPCLKIFHQFAMDQFVGKDAHIGWVIFELEDLTDSELHHLDSLDKIIVCSEWAKKVVLQNFEKYGKLSHPLKYWQDNVYVVPLGVSEEFEPELSQDVTTVFFMAGKWEIRKNHHKVIEALCKAFSPNDQVKIVCMCDNIFYNQEENDHWRNMYSKSKVGDKVVLLTRRPSHKEVAQVMRQCDAYISMSSGEGWDLPVLEAMACGKWPIVINHSGPTEFVNAQNSYLISVNDFELAYDGHFFLNNGKVNTGRWAAVGDKQVNQLVEYLKFIHELKQSGKLSLNVNGIETAKRFSWSNTVDKLLEVI